MAQVATVAEDRLDYLLDYLTDAWQELPRIVTEIDDWDLLEQLDYVEEWGAKDSLAHKLEELLDTPSANDAQRARYADLQRLISRNRPILDSLRAS
jgi:hypothetical protein